MCGVFNSLSIQIELINDENDQIPIQAILLHISLDESITGTISNHDFAFIVYNEMNSITFSSYDFCMCTFCILYIENLSELE